MGAHRKESLDDGSVYAAIESELVHPEFQKGNNEYDFMLIKLGGWMDPRRIVPLNSQYRIPPRNDPNVQFDIMGFGQTSEDGEESEFLQHAVVKPIAAEECREIYDMYAFDEPTMICALDNGKDSCTGDSGGPLIYNGVQVGITSWGLGCARFPGVYARVSAAYGWIIQNVCRMSDQPPVYCDSDWIEKPAVPPADDTFWIRVDLQYESDAIELEWVLVNTDTNERVAQSSNEVERYDHSLVSTYAFAAKGNYQFNIKGQGKKGWNEYYYLLVCDGILMFFFSLECLGSYKVSIIENRASVNGATSETNIASGTDSRAFRIAEPETAPPTRSPTPGPTPRPVVELVETPIPTNGMESFAPTPVVSSQPTGYDGPTVDVEIWITIDQYPEEVVWKILDFSGRNVIERMSPGFYEQEGGWISTITLRAKGIYTFVLTEAKGRSNGKWFYMRAKGMIN